MIKMSHSNYMTHGVGMVGKAKCKFIRGRPANGTQVQQVKTITMLPVEILAGWLDFEVLTADFRNMQNCVCKNSATLAMLTHDVMMPVLQQRLTPTSLLHFSSRPTLDAHHV